MCRQLLANLQEAGFPIEGKWVGNHHLNTTFLCQQIGETLRKLRFHQNHPDPLDRGPLDELHQIRGGRLLAFYLHGDLLQVIVPGEIAPRWMNHEEATVLIKVCEGLGQALIQVIDPLLEGIQPNLIVGAVCG